MAELSVISKILATPIPKILYHYTNSSGLKGIITSKHIWITKIQYLNDRSELQLAFEYFLQEINRQIHKTKNLRALEELEDMQESLKGIDKVNIGVVSFSAQADQLSQWRGYCKIGDGYSIGFHSQKLLTQEKKIRGYHLVPCVYDEQMHELMAHEFIERTRTINTLHAPYYSKPPFLKMTFAETALLVAPMIKPPSFKEEEEWRLVSPFLAYGTGDFRPGIHSLIPYWKFDINIIDTLASITIGPTPEPDLSGLAVSGFLTGELLTNTFGGSHPVFENIKNSKISYRNV